jgi:HPt (histidine-containing phosphotransfer) domain-containing protein
MSIAGPNGAARTKPHATSINLQQLQAERETMPRQLPIEIFMPPNMLKAKLGTSPVNFDAAVKRAEAAMEDLKTEFTGWLASDVEKLLETRDRFAALRDGETYADLFRAAHDLKGGARTYDFPLVARVAASLAKLIEGVPSPEFARLSLVDAHVDAIRALFRDNVRDGSKETAVRLTQELESRVAEDLERSG